MFHVAYQAHNGGPGRFASAAHSLAYHFLVGPVLAGQVLINHHHRIASDAVLISEVASGAQGDAEGSKVSGTDEADVAMRARISGTLWPAFNGERCRAVSAAERQWRSGSRSLHSGN